MQLLYCRKLILVLLFFGAYIVQAQDSVTRVITMQEAINMVLQQNKRIKLDSIKMLQAQYAYEEAKEKKLPDVKASASYLQMARPNVDLKFGQSGSGGGMAVPSQVMYGMVTGSLPIYAGGAVKYGIQSAEYLEKASVLDAAQNKEELIVTTIEMYANLFKAQSNLSLVKENMLQSTQRAKDFANLEKNGLLARNDYLKSELQKSTVTISYSEANNNLSLANFNMNLLLGLPVNTILKLDTSTIDRSMDLQPLDTYINWGLERSDLKALDYRVKAAETGVSTVKAQAKPVVALTGGYAAINVPKLLTVTNAINLGLGLSYNISSLWKLKSKVSAATAQVEQLKLNSTILQDQVRMQVNKQYLDWVNAKNKIDLYGEAVNQAAENYRIVKNKFNNSMATTTDLLEADVLLLQTRMNQMLSRADAFVAYHKLLQATGTLSSHLKK